MSIGRPSSEGMIRFDRMTEMERENRLARILVQSSVDGLFALDRATRYTLWNAAMERFAGKRSEEVLGRRAFDVFPFLRDLGLEDAIRRALAGETVATDEVPNEVPSGEVHYFDRLYMPLREDDGSVVGVIGVVRDVTSRRQAEQALRASEDKLRMAVQASGIGLWSSDPDCDEVWWDPPLCEIFGVAEGTRPKGRAGYLAFVHPDDRERAEAVIARGVKERSWEDEHRIVRPDGAVRWVLVKGTLSERQGRRLAVGSVLDVTERHQRDEQVRQSQKLEALGQLTAGIAHNFNNLLMVLLANVQFAASKAPADLAPLLTSAEQAGVRAAAVVRQLMTFAGRNRPIVRRPMSIGLLMESTIELCRTTFDRRITIATRHEPSAWAMVDPTQLEQAIVNILLNARDAIEGADVAEPRIDVSVDVVPASAGDVGRRVRIRVVDNGPGMAPTTLARAFEPFFTTKEVGKGTGLGLATTHAIVREHGGDVACESSPGKGATLTIHLPLASKLAPPEPTRLATPALARGNETVLVVDDEAAIRAVVARVLESAGYTPRLASSGDEALRMLSDATLVAEVSLVLLDVSMPGLSGRELRHRLRELLPNARVVYLTGYAFDAVDVGDDIVLEKPVVPQQLLETVRAALDRA
jgi:PAS domain S-box-containing protein